MHSMRSGLRSGMICLIIATFMLSAFVVFGFKARTEKNGIEAKEFRAENLYISQAPVPIDQVINQLTNRLVWDDFLSKNAGHVWIDPRSGRPASLTQAIPLIPGTGENNHITLDELGSTVGYKVDKVTDSVMKDAVVKFLEKYANLLNIDPKEIGEIRIANSDGNYIWQISVRRQINGIIVRSANISITLNHGNVALWGVEKWCDVNIDLAPAITQGKALDVAFNYLGGRLAVDSVAKTPHLEIIPVNLNWDGAVGKGYDHILAWVFTFKREGQPGNWEMIVDAHQGKLVAMQDTNLYVAKKIVGMAYPLSNDGCNPQGTATSTPMAFTNTGMASPNNYTNFGGFYEYTGGTATTTLSGKYVHVGDTCGAVNETSTTGDIDMGGTTGQHDCTVPSGHSIGDTMSSKAAGAEIPQINRMAAGYLSYGWLNTSIGCNVNLNSTCNAYYNGSINFYRSGGGCGNTGEIAAVFDHEWSHGIDDHDPAGASNPGEVIADVIANQRLHTSCTGEGFFVSANQGCGQWSCTGHPNVGYNCDGYGDCCTDCTGIRDADYAKHTSGNPHTPAFICAHCGGGGGPCGMEVHCENGPAAEAQWDIGARDLQAAPYNYDKQTAFEISTRVILIGSGGVDDWYTCTCPSTSGGCAATNGYMQYITADDDDGNINNGTPHMTALYNAFNRHGIACASPTPTQHGCSGGPTAASTITATPANNSVSLSWTTVTGAASYKVFRGEGPLGGNCDIGKQIIASVSGTSYTDAEALNGRTYYYQVQAVGSNAACLGPMSNCVSATPVPCTSCCAFSSAVLTGNPTGGDSDAYMDNCESASIQVTVSNIGSGIAQSCTVNITAVSNFYTITTSMPVNLGNIPVGSNATTTFSVNVGQGTNKATCLQTGTFHITAQATGQTQIASNDFTFVNEVDILQGTVNWPFETSLDGWTVEGGTWALSTAHVNPGGSTHSAHSSDSLDANCDIMISPEYEATSTTALHTPNWYSTEPFSGTYWYDRANFWVVPSATGIETVINPASGKMYATGNYYDWPGYCGQLSSVHGWAGNATADMTWGDSVFNLGTYNAQKFKLRMKYMTDDLTHGSGVYLDDMYMTNVKYQGCDQQTNTCGTNPQLQPYQNLKPTVDDTGSTKQNGIIEPNENANLIGTLENIGGGNASSVTGQLTTTSPITITQANATYPDIASGAHQICNGTCYGVYAPLANRPATHWDFNVTENAAATGYGPVPFAYTYHVGESFSDVPYTNLFYSYIEKLLHSGVTAGCTGTTYCPAALVLRQQMGKFICAAMQADSPGACTTTTCAQTFSDVPSTNVFCPYIEALYTKGVVSGCGTSPLKYCPTDNTQRQGMAKFICLGMNQVSSGSCATNACAGTFTDVPSSNPFCTYIEGLYTAGVISGCTASTYCPTNNVTREQMSKFLVNAFGFEL